MTALEGQDNVPSDTGEGRVTAAAGMGHPPAPHTSPVGCWGHCKPHGDKFPSPPPPGSQVAQQHTEELAQLQAEVGMLRCHMERTGPRLPPAILPPPVAPPLPPALAAPELFKVRKTLVPGLFPGLQGQGTMGSGCCPRQDNERGGTGLGRRFRNCSLGHSWGHGCPTEPGPPGGGPHPRCKPRV